MGSVLKRLRQRQVVTPDPIVTPIKAAGGLEAEPATPAEETDRAVAGSNAPETASSEGDAKTDPI